MGLFDHFDLDRWIDHPPALPGGIYGLFRRVFTRRSSEPALEAPDGRVWTYAELESAVEQCRIRLEARGVGPGERVLAYVEKSPAAVLLYLACLSQGAVYVGVNPAYTGAELLELVRDCAPGLVVCDPSRKAHVSKSIRGGGAAVEIAALPAEDVTDPSARPPARSGHHLPMGDDPAVILYTSGTTGRPRGVVLTHRAIAANGLALCRVWDFRPDDVLVHALPLFHTHGLLVALNCALLAGGSIIFMPAFDPGKALGFFHRATVFMGVPTYYTRLLKHPNLRRSTVRGMRLLTSGSAPLLPQVWIEFEERCGHRIVERYGMTEVGIITSNPFRGERVPGSVGYALEGVRIKAVDPTGAEVAPGVTGELCVRSAGAFTGYWGNRQEPAQDVNPQGWVATGDLAVLGDDRRVTLMGRSKDLIITGGLNVHPMQVEVALNALPGVAESAVFGVPHPDYGEGVVAAVVWDGQGEPSAAGIRRRLSSRLAGYRIPKRILITEGLPRNAMGKVQKTVLRSRHAGMFLE